MRVRNVRWVGTATTEYDAMVSFLRDVLGLRPTLEEATTVEFATSEGDAFQVMGPGDPYHDFFAAHANGPVPLLEVDDVQQALAELLTAGIEIVGAMSQDSHWQWIHFRAPDGNLYELASRRNSSPRTPSPGAGGP